MKPVRVAVPFFFSACKGHLMCSFSDFYPRLRCGSLYFLENSVAASDKYVQLFIFIILLKLMFCTTLFIPCLEGNLKTPEVEQIPVVYSFFFFAKWKQAK